MWIVYRPGTIEYPRHWVARMHLALPKPRSTRFVMTHDSLDELRQMLPPEAICFERSAEDLPEIHEVWIA
jgi:hypothetical protein